MPELGQSDQQQTGFYAVLPTPLGLLGGLELLAEAAALGAKLPQGFDQAAAIDTLAATVERQVVEASVQTVKIADEAAREAIIRTRVRPNYSTFGGMFEGLAPGAGRKRLEDAIHSEPLGLGEVGIGSIQELDTVVGVDGRPFWRTQEYGSTHNVGRTVVGLFQPGNSLPDQTMFRQHAVFIAGAGGPMNIQRPIPARHFLRSGAEAAEFFRERAFRETQGIAVDEIRAIRATLII